MVKLPPITFVVLDTETTGFVPRVHKVIEYAAVRVEDGKIVDTYEQLLWTEEVPPVVEALTRIRTASLQGMPRFRDAQEDILKHMGEDTLIVGQNVLFDINMLKGEGLDLSERPWVDTSMLASIVFPELESYSLGYLSRVLKLDHEPMHRALGDVKATLGLLAACWERMQELTPEFQEVAQLIAAQSTPGYKMLFEALPKAKKKKKPKWLTLPHKIDVPMGTSHPVTLPTPARGTVQLVEETLEPKLLEQLIAACVQDKTAQHWIAVKNLEATVAHEKFPENEVRILYPPFLLPDRDAVKIFAAQDVFTADEATLAIKLAWYEPEVQSDLPIHGGEEAVWNGKLASSDRSDIYTKQFDDLPGVILLDHRQLLAFLADPEHSAHDILGKDAHVIITDASMLEDTATKAYGWHTSIDDLRAGVEGNTELRKFVDLLQLWIEKIRNFQDLRYITKNDLGGAETKGLRDQLEVLLQDPSQSPRMQRLLHNLSEFLEPEVLPDRIAWIETRQNGSQYLESVPDRIGNLLREHLYGKFPTSLLIPPGSETTLKETLPVGTETTIARPMFEDKRIAIDLPEQKTLEMYLTNPPAGKTILLLPSRGAIIDMYVKHVERLEAEGVTMLCQGVSGGQGRMQAEFLVSEGPTLWLVTPWVFEGIHLPAYTVDHLVLQTLPFDHPSHAITSRRAGHYRDSFEEYVLARLEHRLFRILRTYARMRKPAGDVSILDDRLRSKGYGKRVQAYLDRFAQNGTPEAAVKFSKKGGTSGKNQLSLF